MIGSYETFGNVFENIISFMKIYAKDILLYIYHKFKCPSNLANLFDFVHIYDVILIMIAGRIIGNLRAVSFATSASAGLPIINRVSTSTRAARNIRKMSASGSRRYIRIARSRRNRIKNSRMILKRWKMYVSLCFSLLNIKY